MTWKPYCYETRCGEKHEKRKPTHGSCCTCQECGQVHDECICKYYSSSCISCIFNNG